MATALVDGDPQRLGKYWLAGRLGAGGQGVVYEAYGEDGLRVAIKVLHGDPASDPELRERFGKEATAAQRVASFCTAGVIAAELDGARPYIVSEYVEGMSLRQAVSGGRRFAGDDLHRLGTAIATALTAIHDAGVIHRDMKPDNVLLGPDGPRVIDFGVARTLDMSLTATGLVTGTPTYMAPEVFTGQRAGTPADVFAWGGIMLFAVTGQDPFEGESLGGVMHRVLSSDPDLSALPGSLRGLVGAALNKDPAARPTARQLLLALISGDGRLDTVRLLAEGSREGGRVHMATDDPGMGTLAEDSYAMLHPVEQALAPEVFLRLITVDDDGELRARRAGLAEFPDGARRLLEVFAYLITGDGREIWLTRIALPHAWPRLRSWVEANRDGLAAHREIWTAVRRWETRGRRDADLLQGHSLRAAVRWAATERRDIVLSPAERDFLDEGTALARRRSRRARLLTVALAGLLVVALAAGALAVRQSGVADERSATIAVQHDQSEARRVATLADPLRVTEPVKAMLLSVASWRLARVPEARAALSGSLTQQETAAFHDPATAAQTLRVLSRDGRTLVSVGDDSVRVWDMRTSRKTGGFTGVGKNVRAVALSPSGRTLAVMGGGGVRVWDVRTGRVRGARLLLRALEIEAVRTGLLFGHAEDLLVVTHDEEQTVWNLRTGEKRRPPVHVLDTAPDGRHIVGDSPAREIEIRDLAGPGKISFGRVCNACAFGGAYSADGKLVAVTKGSSVEVKETATGGTAADTLSDGSRGELLFSPDGRHLASYTGSSITIWSDFNLVPVLVHKIDSITPSLAFDPDGRTVRYLEENTVVTLDLGALLGPARLKGTDGGAVLSPDGRLLAARPEGTHRVTLWDVRLRRPVGAPLDVGRGSFFHMAFTPDGRRLAVSRQGSSGGGSTIGIWDTSSLKRVATVSSKGQGGVTAMAFSPDGTALAAAVEETAATPDSTIHLWDLPGGRQRWVLRQDGVTGLAFHPDGRSLGVAGGENRLVDVATGKAVGRPYGAPASNVRVVGLAFSKDGSRIAVGAGIGSGGDIDAGRLSVWDTATRSSRGAQLRAGTDGVFLLAYSPRGDVVAAVVDDKKVMLWDVSSGMRLGQPIAVHTDHIESLAFTADGSRLLSVDETGTLSEHVVDPDQAASAVCARAGRTLTGAEWRAYLPSLSYRDVCPR
ncbi:WD40 repeat protein [Streptosporangium album]|uniref:WD40 repeat protein n=1 Tax=Streptosporangium album TaxID=47479 RepID=A0A7W7RYM2_9ACTN|nr:WD40 repeat domain-containing serine/threonine protein kinase [Streptosporangium album]MBB4940535.1 WD40 repeat protein [Streptosporangium album]